MNIGLALGSGSARGWAHIGIIAALNELGIQPNIICGTSIGSLVGASYVSNNLDKLEEWARSLTKFEIAKFFKLDTSLNSFVNKEKLHYFLNKYVAKDDSMIENFNKRYAAIATELESGREIWLTKGSLIEAVWCSIALPGLFPAIKTNNQWLVDGGLVNPVPVSVCRALGADIVIAVDLNGAIVRNNIKANIANKNTSETSKFRGLVREYAASVFPAIREEDKPPSLFDAITSSINIIQNRIARTRMAGDPPDILLSPRLSHIGLLEFHLANEAIIEGRKSVLRQMEELEYILESVDRS